MATFMLMMFIWMFFYEPNMDIVAKNVASVFSVTSYDLTYFMKFLNGNVSKCACGITFIWVSFIIVFIEYLSGKKTRNPYGLFLSSYTCMLMIVGICMFTALQPSQFIYFAF